MLSGNIDFKSILGIIYKSYQLAIVFPGIIILNSVRRQCRPFSISHIRLNTARRFPSQVTASNFISVYREIKTIQLRSGIVYCDSKLRFLNQIFQIAMLYGKSPVSVKLGKIGKILSGKRLKLESCFSGGNHGSQAFFIGFNRNISFRHGSYDLNKTGRIDNNTPLLRHRTFERGFKTFFKIISAYIAGAF